MAKQLTIQQANATEIIDAKQYGRDGVIKFWNLTLRDPDGDERIITVDVDHLPADASKQDIQTYLKRELTKAPPQHGFSRTIKDQVTVSGTVASLYSKGK